jgi:hypothetical protein
VIGGRAVLLTLALGTTIAATGCAGARIVDGVYQSPKGYRFALPSDGWTLTRATRADIEITHGPEPGGIVVNATCRDVPSRATLDVLARHLLIGLRDRTIVSVEDISLNGKVARHAVLEGRLASGEDPVRVELYVVRDDRCVYDFLYAAPTASFDDLRARFHDVVRSFRTE